MYIENVRPPVIYGSPLIDVENTLKAAYIQIVQLSGGTPQLLLCLLPNTGVPLYGVNKECG